MKKYNLFKVLAITIFVAWLLTLIIPGSSADYSGNITKGDIAGVGIWALLSNLSISISYFNGIAIFLIAVACFYAILSKVNVYNLFVNKVASMFSEKKGLLIAITTIIFGVLASVVSEWTILIVFVPFIYMVMKELEIDKKVILSSTIIASIIGSMCGIYNSTLFNMFNLKLNTLLLVKVILLVLSLFILIIFTAPRKTKKENVRKTKKEDSKTEKTSTKAEVKKNTSKKVSEDKNDNKVNKTLYAILTILLGTFGVNKFYARKFKAGVVSLLFCWTLVPTILSIAEFITVLTQKADKNGEISVNSSRIENVIFGTSLVLFVIFTLFTIIPWESLIEKFTAFSDFNTWISNLKIGNYSIFNNIIGQPVIVDATLGSNSGVISALGSWQITDIAIFLLILSAAIAMFNGMKFNDFIAESTKGIKKVLPVAITAMLISIVLILMVTTGVNITIANFILTLTKGFNIATSTLTAMIGSVLTGDFYYFTSTVGSVYQTVITNSDYYGVVALILQSVFNLMMIVAPTSVGLIIGLYYLDIPYNKWLKFIWKVFLSIFVIIIIAAVVIYFLV